MGELYIKAGLEYLSSVCFLEAGLRHVLVSVTSVPLVVGELSAASALLSAWSHSVLIRAVLFV